MDERGAKRVGEDRAPLVQAIFEHVARRQKRYHFPGHKGQALSGEATMLFGPSLKHDLTELAGLDDLNAPSGVIKEAQELASAAFGADHTFFLVGGASAGVIAALWAAAGEGSVVALPRNCHRSAVAALVLSGATPVWTMPRLVAGLQAPVPLGVDGIYVPGAAATLVVSPTYEGLCMRFGEDVPGVIIVDEAHGAHLYFSRMLPPGALAHNVDACVHGAHKTMGSLTGTGFLHIKGQDLDAGRVAQLLSAIQTTSPSYLMMASLDLARRDMVVRGESLITRALEEAEHARRLLDAAGIDYLKPDGEYDPLKLVIPSLQFGFSGLEMGELLAQEGAMIEYAALTHVVAIFSAGDTEGSGAFLARAVQRVAQKSVSRETEPTEGAKMARAAVSALSAMALPRQAMTPRQAWQHERRTVPIEQSAGCVAAESVYAYPPGSPLLVQGEIVPETFCEVIGMLKRAGVHFQGTRDPALCALDIVEE